MRAAEQHHRDAQASTVDFLCNPHMVCTLGRRLMCPPVNYGTWVGVRNQAENTEGPQRPIRRSLSPIETVQSPVQSNLPGMHAKSSVLSRDTTEVDMSRKAKKRWHGDSKVRVRCKKKSEKSLRCSGDGEQSIWGFRPPKGKTPDKLLQSLLGKFGSAEPWQDESLQS